MSGVSTKAEAVELLERVRREYYDQAGHLIKRPVQIISWIAMLTDVLFYILNQLPAEE